MWLSLATVGEMFYLPDDQVVNMRFMAREENERNLVFKSIFSSPPDLKEFRFLDMNSLMVHANQDIIHDKCKEAVVFLKKNKKRVRNKTV